MRVTKNDFWSFDKRSISCYFNAHSIETINDYPNENGRTIKLIEWQKSSDSSGDKEKIDVTVNVNINGIPKTKKKKSQVESTTSSKKSDTPVKTSNTTTEEPADKRSIVRDNKVLYLFYCTIFPSIHFSSM